MRLKVFLAAALLFAPAVLPGTRPSSAVAAAKDEVVATVGTRRITLGQLEQTLADEAVTHLALYKSDDQVREEALQDLIDRQLAWLDAQKLDLRRDPDFIAVTEAAVDTWLAKKYLSQVVDPAAAAQPQDLKKYSPPRFEQVHVRQIAVPSEQEAREVLARLKNGEDFMALAREESIAPTAASGGELGWLVRWGRHFYSWDAIEPLYDLEPGAVSPVIKTELGYEIFQVLERAPLSPEEIEEFLVNPRELVRMEKIQAHLERVYRERGVALDEAAAARLATEPALPRATVLGRVGDWKLTAGFVRGYLAGISNPQQRPPLATPAQAQKLCGDLLRQKALRQAMEAQGFLAEPGSREKIDAFVDRTLSEFYVDRVMSGVKLTDEDRAAFFSAKKGGFLIPPRVRLRLIVVNEAERILKIYALLAQGKEWDALANAYSVDGSAAAGGDLGWVYLNRVEPAYQEAVKKLAVGSWSQPLESSGKFMLVRLDGREEERFATFEEAKPIFEADALRQKGKKHFENYMKKLRAEYPVKIFPAVVKKAQRPARAEKPAGAPSPH